jgi:lipopolysaccharide transport system permease protein
VTEPAAPLPAAMPLGPLGPRLRRVRHLVRTLAEREFKTRYRQSVLDVAWGFVSPIVIMAVYGVILRGAFDVEGDGLPYLSFAWTGVVVWTFFASGLGNGIPSLIHSADLVSKVYFPREAIPLAAVSAALIDFAIASITVVVLAFVQDVGPGLTAVAVVVPLAVLVLWTAAIAVVGGVVSVFVRDVNHFAQLVLRVGFFATPVMYPVSHLPSELQWIGAVNPVAVAIEAIRDTVLRGVWPDWPLLAVHGIVGLVVFVYAILYTREVEDRIVDVL